MQRTIKLVIDSVRLGDGSEAGYLEGQNEHLLGAEGPRTADCCSSQIRERQALGQEVDGAKGLRGS